ncbi:hypothetical protein NE237_005112 [Protea cynaroides]|uniref:RNase H type-1 domain-containing protein n=1 Tax=Protea cynaroides TaxID=273540 RepID=A0A9Q0QU55_9MAGN|nr:hypothetical protein NE237_005112 [Protea cynaroides]
MLAVSVVEEIQQQFSSSNVTTSSHVPHKLWLARNDPYFQQKKSSPMEVVRHAEKAFHEYQAIWEDTSCRNLQSDSNNHRVWKPPPQGWISLSADAAFIDANHQGGMGYAARNSQGEILLAVSQSGLFLNAALGDVLTIKFSLEDVFVRIG